MTKRLSRAVYLDGFLLAEGTELTGEQAERITNPKAYTDPKAPAEKSEPAVETVDTGTGVRAAAGAQLARGKSAASKTA